MAKRIGIMFLFWSFVYVLPYDLTQIQNYGVLGPIKASYWKIYNLSQDPIRLIMQGTKVHLWFLIGLLFSIYISAFFIYQKLSKGLLVTSIFLYLFGLLAKAYADTPMVYILVLILGMTHF